MGGLRYGLAGLVLIVGTAGQANLLTNGDFSAGNLGSGNYRYPDGTYQSWNYVVQADPGDGFNGGNAALVNAEGSSKWYGASSPGFSTQFAALQRSSILTQTFNLTVGQSANYDVFWTAAGRPSLPSSPAGGNQSYTAALLKCKIGGSCATLASSTYTTRTGSQLTDQFLVGPYLTPQAGYDFEVAFTGHATTDQTAFIATVSVDLDSGGGGGGGGGLEIASAGRVFALQAGAVPEPATWLLGITGFALTGLALRSGRRRLA